MDRLLKISCTMICFMALISGTLCDHIFPFEHVVNLEQSLETEQENNKSDSAEEEFKFIQDISLSSKPDYINILSFLSFNQEINSETYSEIPYPPPEIA